MIYKAIQLIETQLSQYIQPVAGPDEVVAGNIALYEAPDQDQIKDKVVISLVNIEEESTLKNGLNYYKTVGGLQYTEPPVHVNLYLLFTAHYPQAYDKSLTRIGDVIRFFQGRKCFDVKNAQPLPDGFDLSNPQDSSIYLTMELYTLTFEQINHLWGSLGGKQMPFVMYKARLVTISEYGTMGSGPLIEEIRNNVGTDPEAC